MYLGRLRKRAKAGDIASGTQKQMPPRGYIDIFAPPTISGWAYDPDAGDAGVVCIANDLGDELFIWADAFRSDLKAASIGDGNCAFEASLPDWFLRAGVTQLTVTLGGAGKQLVGGNLALHNGTWRPATCSEEASRQPVKSQNLSATVEQVDADVSSGDLELAYLRARDNLGVSKAMGLRFRWLGNFLQTSRGRGLEAHKLLFSSERSGRVSMQELTPSLPAAYGDILLKAGSKGEAAKLRFRSFASLVESGAELISYGDALKLKQKTSAVVIWLGEQPSIANGIWARLAELSDLKPLVFSEQAVAVDQRDAILEAGLQLVESRTDLVAAVADKDILVHAVAPVLLIAEHIAFTAHMAGQYMAEALMSVVLGGIAMDISVGVDAALVADCAGMALLTQNGSIPESYGALTSQIAAGEGLQLGFACHVIAQTPRPLKPVVLVHDFDDAGLVADMVDQKAHSARLLSLHEFAEFLCSDQVGELSPDTPLFFLTQALHYDRDYIVRMTALLDASGGVAISGMGFKSAFAQEDIRIDAPNHAVPGRFSFLGMCVMTIADAAKAFVGHAPAALDELFWAESYLIYTRGLVNGAWLQNKKTLTGWLGRVRQDTNQQIDCLNSLDAEPHDFSEKGWLLGAWWDHERKRLDDLRHAILSVGDHQSLTREDILYLSHVRQNSLIEQLVDDLAQQIFLNPSSELANKAIEVALLSGYMAGLSRIWLQQLDAAAECSDSLPEAIIPGLVFANGHESAKKALLAVGMVQGQTPEMKIITAIGGDDRDQMTSGLQAFICESGISAAIDLLRIYSAQLRAMDLADCYTELSCFMVPKDKLLLACLLQETDAINACLMDNQFIFSPETRALAANYLGDKAPLNDLLADAYEAQDIARLELTGDSFESLMAALDQQVQSREAASRTAGGMGAQVSVIMSAFKPDMALMKLAVSSILGQTHANFELIIVDDNSGPDFAEAIAELGTLDSRITIVQQASNSGPYVARNAALEIANGDYIAFHDCDDFAHPQKLEIQLQALQADPLRRAVFAQHVRIDAAGVVQLEQGGNLFGDAPVSMMVPRSLFDRIGFFLPVRSRGDVEFRDRIHISLGRSAIYNIEVPLIYCYAAPTTLSAQVSAEKAMALKMFKESYVARLRTLKRGVGYGDRLPEIPIDIQADAW